eukprot:359834-Chlamydomonas_euryale.AAC.7
MPPSTKPPCGRPGGFPLLSQHLATTLIHRVFPCPHLRTLLRADALADLLNLLQQRHVKVVSRLWQPLHPLDEGVGDAAERDELAQVLACDERLRMVQQHCAASQAHMQSRHVPCACAWTRMHGRTCMGADAWTSTHGHTCMEAVAGKRAR